MYLHIVPDQWANTNFCSDRYSYLPIARCDLHYTDELIAGTLTQHQCFMPENAVVCFTRSLWRECFIESNQTAYKQVFFGGEFRECNNSLHISGKTSNFLWDGLMVFNTGLSVPYFAFGLDNAFCTLIRVVIRIFDVVFLAEANFTLVLWRSWKTNIFRFKNITVCFITNFIVFFVFWKDFVHFLYWEFWIKISLVWCILAFLVADCWIVWVYVEANDFCITLIGWRMTTPAIFKRCYCTVVTLTLSTHHFDYYSILFETKCAQKHRFTYNYIFAIF